MSRLLDTLLPRTVVCNNWCTRLHFMVEKVCCVYRVYLWPLLSRKFGHFRPEKRFKWKKWNFECYFKDFITDGEKVLNLFHFDNGSEGWRWGSGPLWQRKRGAVNSSGLSSLRFFLFDSVHDSFESVCLFSHFINSYKKRSKMYFPVSTVVGCAV